MFTHMLEQLAISFSVVNTRLNCLDLIIQDYIMKQKSIPEKRFSLLVHRKAHVLDMPLIQSTNFNNSCRLLKLASTTCNGHIFLILLFY